MNLFSSDIYVYVDHIDRNKDNNYVSNLRWATSSEQVFNENTDKVHSKEHMNKITKMAREKKFKVNRKTWYKWSHNSICYL